MVTRRIHLVASIMLLSACADATFLSRSDSREASPEGWDQIALGSLARDGVRYPCNWSRPARGGPYRYRYGRASVQFPRREVAPGGETTLFRVIGRPAGGEPVFAAACVIPATDAAAARMYRFFGLADAGATTLAAPDGTMARQCTWVNGACVFEPIGDPVSPCPRSTASAPAEAIGDGACTGGGDPEWGGEPYEPPPDDPGGGGDPGGDEPLPPDPCATGDPVIDSEPLQDALQSLWTQSNPGANLAQRREQGGWIVRTAGGYSVVQFQNVRRSFCKIEGEEPLPNGEIVGFVHTHPYGVGETIVNCAFQIIPYEGRPSEDDVLMSAFLGQLLGRAEPLPGYIIDGDGIRRFAQGQPTTSYERCGY